MVHAIKFNICFVSDVTCLNMNPRITYQSLLGDLRDIYKFHPKENFTLKWIDEDGMNPKSSYIFEFKRNSVLITQSSVC